MVCCLYVGICFGVAPHHMLDQVVTLAWHTRPHTCEAWHVYIRMALGGNVGILLGMDLWSTSPLYLTLRFDTCMERSNTCRMHF